MEDIMCAACGRYPHSPDSDGHVYESIVDYEARN